MGPTSVQGTYFASAFAVFLRSHFLPKVREIQKQGRRAYVIFPDFGAHRRFFRSEDTADSTLDPLGPGSDTDAFALSRVSPVVRSGGCTLNDQQPCRPEMLPLDQILYLEKKRVGAEIEQSTVLQYKDERGAARDAKPLAIDSHVIIADDFTNSGSTLFGGAKVVRNSTEGGKGGTLTVEAYVTHFVAKCARPPPKPVGRHRSAAVTVPPCSQTRRRRSRGSRRSCTAPSTPRRARALRGLLMVRRACRPLPCYPPWPTPSLAPTSHSSLQASTALTLSPPSPASWKSTARS